ncbi:phytochrome family protein [Pararhodospirillum oryzae]|uniref:Histidine kinase/HSP90-like ATPase domain-containing protein n=1 Tax=Pararhodospirillum oryzae TaxID=478448 RepID=A0A512H7Y4_9PROT|nr:HAMP domain-containing histidine kinase [Pararhodospirillum oryzae]GEO81551.1 hypothetical protein ROR02_16820 [Pararhodospirillum oryzae]
MTDLRETGQAGLIVLGAGAIVAVDALVIWAIPATGVWPPLVAVGVVATLVLGLLTGLAARLAGQATTARREARRRTRALALQTRIRTAVMDAFDQPLALTSAQGRRLAINRAYGALPDALHAAVTEALTQPAPVSGPDTTVDEFAAGTEGRILAWTADDGRTRRTRLVRHPIASGLGLIRLEEEGALAPAPAPAPVAPAPAARLSVSASRARVPSPDAPRAPALPASPAESPKPAESAALPPDDDDVPVPVPVPPPSPPRRPAAPEGPLDANEVLASALEALADRIHETGADIRSGVLPMVVCARPWLEDLLQTLVGTALHAAVPDRPLRISIGGRVEEGNAILTVEDNGNGTGAETLGDDRRGRLLSVKSSLGVGTTVTVTLPAASGPRPLS